MMSHTLGFLSLVDSHASARAVGGYLSAPSCRRGGPLADEGLRVVTPGEDSTQRAAAATVSSSGFPGLKTTVNAGKGLPPRGLRRAWAWAA